MTEDFETWLAQDPVASKDYKKHPELRENIFEEYQYEIITKVRDRDKFIRWVLSNEEVAREHLPYVVNILEKAVLKYSAADKAAIIQTTAESFPAWRNQSYELIGPAKFKFIKSQIELHKLILAKADPKPVLVRKTIENLRDEFEASLSFWEQQAYEYEKSQDVPPVVSTDLQIEINELVEEEGGWKYFFNAENEYSLLLKLLEANFTSLEYSLPTHSIKTKGRTKIKLGNLLGKIHHRKSSNRKVQSDVGFLELVKCIDVFKDERHIAKCLTRDRL